MGVFFFFFVGSTEMPGRVGRNKIPPRLTFASHRLGADPKLQVKLSVAKTIPPVGQPPWG